MLTFELSFLLHTASHLQGRSWQGLERRLGETEVKGAVKGRQGLPTSYTHETQQ